VLKYSFSILEIFGSVCAFAGIVQLVKLEIENLLYLYDIIHACGVAVAVYIAGL